MPSPAERWSWKPPIRGLRNCWTRGSTSRRLRAACVTSRSGRGRLADGGIGADEFHSIPFRVGDVERAPVDPGVFGGLDAQPELLEPLLLGPKICEGDLKRQVIQRRFSWTPAFGPERTHKQREDLGVACIPLRNSEEGRRLGPRHQLKAD